MAQEPTGTQGWRQFHSSKERMLAEYDRARSLASIREVQTFHGNVAESELRRWLEGFLPKRFGVTSGYVISQGQRDTTKAPHFDVIIYDALESPVLWIEESSDLSPAGQARGIPAEYVRSVIEVKAAFSTRTVRDALEHLSELEPLLIGVDPSEERYKRYLPPSFFASTVFFEVRKEDQF